MPTAVQTALPLESDNRRYASRRALRLGSTLTDSGVEVLIHDLSPTGLLIETAQSLAAGETLFVDLPERGPTAATVVWSGGNFHGCAFELSIPAAAVSAALLRSPALARKQAPDGQMDVAQLQALAAEADSFQPADERYSLRTRGLVLVALLGLSWGAIAWAVSAIL
ncbi:PilZ domain-containing protein [Sphingomonas sp. KRR8]|uniref:PilZ domain-containing protein n=1 Tax=Sphingomonas sp. KRR8 TaxID=2942996 RepID=UPI002021C2F6|nr:PilZ domain-containing protein [Sphingomonas sp. KRR8]URD60606.1 PilZ domain-containing protein [Sphingomonas sp. KRR8]